MGCNTPPSPAASTRSRNGSTASSAGWIWSAADIVSGAGHDACWINRIAPTVMVMCLCVDRLAHNEAEKISPEWAAAGTDVLLHAVLDVAEVVG
jgi:beta-ureidopropionase / N-carbamoyl-L-amino-acid hydrolase